LHILQIDEKQIGKEKQEQFIKQVRDFTQLQLVRDFTFHNNNILFFEKLDSQSEN
jgi:hypothetical protein